MKRTLGGLLVFVTMIAVLLGMLQVLNWIPEAVQEGAFRKYVSLEEVRAHFKLNPVYMPAYFPRSVQWPPALIAAQTRPYAAVLTEFMNSDDRSETILIITQTERPYSPLAQKLTLREVRETVQYPFKDRIAVLEAGVCRREEQCSHMAWDEGNFRLSLVMRSSPAELVRIAESIVAQHPGN